LTTKARASESTPAISHPRDFRHAPGAVQTPEQTVREEIPKKYLAKAGQKPTSGSVTKVPIQTNVAKQNKNQSA
jgi:hypothetical protein